MLESVRAENLQDRAFETIIRKFGDAVVKDRELQSKLNAAIDNGVTKEEWIKLYVELAQAKGFVFTAEQMKIAMQEQKQGKDKVLPSMVQKWVTLL